MLGITNSCPALHTTYSAIGVPGAVLGIDDDKDRPLEPGLRALQRQGHRQGPQHRWCI